jgi:hypothetical protein
MGLISALGSLGAAIAAPFTGGTSLAFLPGLIGAGSAAADAIGSSMSGNRQGQNQANLHQNQLAAQLFGTQQNAATQALSQEEASKLNRAGLDLNQRNFALNAPNVRGRQAVAGSLLQNLQPATMSGGSERLRAATPAIQGGMSASALSPEARQMGQLMVQQALEKQQAGDTFEPIPTTDFQSGRLTPPEMAAYEQPGKTESILGLLSMAGPLLEQFRKKTPPVNDASGMGLWAEGG